MHHHRSIGTTSLVALMAAHRMVQERALPTPLDPSTIHRIVDQLWDSNGFVPDKAEAAFTLTASRRPAPCGSPAAG
jgi:hypothetical protein